MILKACHASIIIYGCDVIYGYIHIRKIANTGGGLCTNFRTGFTAAWQVGGRGVRNWDIDFSKTHGARTNTGRC